MSPDLNALEKILAHEFSNRELLVQALTHSSARRKRANKEAPTSTQSYERLEFLGDRVLGLKVARMLFDAFPSEPEGHLAKRHALLVSKPTLAMVARDLGLSEYIMVSQTEREHGGLNNDGILSDVVEALIAALYLDNGIEVAEAFIQTQWQQRLTENRKPPRDAKTSLQEWSQGKIQILPTYSLLEHSGPSHKPTFKISVAVEGYGDANGTGASKREAEQNAAELLIKNLIAGGHMKDQTK